MEINILQQMPCVLNQRKVRFTIATQYGISAGELQFSVR